MKECTRCHKTKPISDFSIRKRNGTETPRSHCKKCASESSIESQRRRREEDPEGWREYRAQKERNRVVGLYGVSLSDIQKLGEAQNWLCAICFRDIRSKYYIDHDHKSGTLRKLLCFHCNVGLGHFGDSIEILSKAIGYLESHEV